MNFWTLTCINWLRQEPYVRAWSQAYRDDGLVVVGVHAPEFSFEHEIDCVRHATRERAIDYPVAVDNGYAVWGAFANRYWPALYFVDADGVIRDEHFGEGRYEQSARVIQRLLGIERALVSVEGLGVEALVKSLRGFKNGYAEVNGVRLHYVVGGKGDIMLPTINSYMRFQQLPDARLLSYPDAGHGALFQNADEFVRAGVQFLDGRGNGGDATPVEWLVVTCARSTTSV